MRKLLALVVIMISLCLCARQTTAAGLRDRLKNGNIHDELAQTEQTLNAVTALKEVHLTGERLKSEHDDEPTYHSEEVIEELKPSAITAGSDDESSAEEPTYMKEESTDDSVQSGKPADEEPKYVEEESAEDRSAVKLKEAKPKNTVDEEPTYVKEESAEDKTVVNPKAKPENIDDEEPKYVQEESVVKPKETVKPKEDVADEFAQDRPVAVSDDEPMYVEEETTKDGSGKIKEVEEHAHADEPIGNHSAVEKAELETMGAEDHDAHEDGEDESNPKGIQECIEIIKQGGRKFSDPLEMEKSFVDESDKYVSGFSQDADTDVHTGLCDPTRDGARILLYGGSFNPPHIGHVLRAIHAIESSNYDCVWFLPAATHPEKPNLLPQDYRINMIRRSIFAYSTYMDVSSLEKFNTKGWTYYTVLGIKKAYPTATFGWLAGGDVYRSMPSWDGGLNVLKEVDMVVTTRSEVDGGKDSVNQEVVDCYKKVYGVRDAVLLGYAPTLSKYSSTLIRKLIDDAGESVAAANAQKTQTEDRALISDVLKQLLAKGLWNWMESHERGKLLLEKYYNAGRQALGNSLMEEL